MNTQLAEIGRDMVAEQKCEHLADLMAVQADMMARHVELHKYFHHLPDMNAAYKDFLHMFGGIMRDEFCRHMCPKRETCFYKDLPPEATLDEKNK